MMNECSHGIQFWEHGQCRVCKSERRKLRYIPRREQRERHAAEMRERNRGFIKQREATRAYWQRKRIELAQAESASVQSTEAAMRKAPVRETQLHSGTESQPAEQRLGT